MGTISKNVNLFKGIFKGLKSLFKSSKSKNKITDFEYSQPTMMTRKVRKRVDPGQKQYHGRKEKKIYGYGGFRSHRNSSDDVIFVPRKKYKGYIKDAKSNFNKKKRGLKKTA